MDPTSAAVFVIALLALATLAGVLWRARAGRVAGPRAQAQVVTPADVTDGAADAVFGERATLLQFSTEHCAFCPATRRLLGALAERTPGVAHVEVDLTRSPALAQRFRVLQTPTTLLLDADGAVRGRIGGPPRPTELEATVADILNGEDHVAA
ncbi:TlpA family protein disulfide reductase [Gryllotalpicola ginsengisoli]|uniref:TlpA family protein disulfide reductase n=1 Tax=Gryllotalpicola ginsengisoli TaxID=444608 RepID=UPI0003B6AFFF|nr:thioredoxin family protein [Gryllotalpicola ginsengisoli]